jgi:hypothetical protein
MRTKLTVLAALAVAAVTLTAVASAGSAGPKQRVAIQMGNASSFVITPLTSGAVKSDRGTIAFCCWTERHTMRDGQAIDINDPKWTLTGKLGTLEGRSLIGWADLPDGWAVFTGTWKVVHGTGAYAGLSGGGRVAGVQLADGNTKVQYEGFVSK